MNDKELNKLTKEQCEELIKMATPEEQKTYADFSVNGAWQMGLVMSGIWSKYKDAYLGTNKTSKKPKQEEKSKEADNVTKKPVKAPVKPKKDLPDPDFDFNNYYCVGDTVFIVKCFPTLSKYEVIRVKLRSVQPRFMVGNVVNGNGYCECMDYAMRDNLFIDPSEADKYLAELKKKYPPKKYSAEDFIDAEEESEE